MIIQIYINEHVVSERLKLRIFIQLTYDKLSQNELKILIRAPYDEKY